jgi:ABC-2 type transport system ATP-binding protein
MTITNADTAQAGRPGGDIPPAVRLRGIRKSFGPVEAVRGIDLTIAPGEVVAFLGPNGAGDRPHHRPG